MLGYTVLDVLSVRYEPTCAGGVWVYTEDLGGSAAESAERIGTSAAETRSRERRCLAYLMSCPAGAALAGGRGLVCLSAPPRQTAKNAAPTCRQSAG